MALAPKKDMPPPPEPTTRVESKRNPREVRHTTLDPTKDVRGSRHQPGPRLHRVRVS